MTTQKLFKHEMHETHEMIFYNLIFRDIRVFRDYNSMIHEWALELSINKSAKIRLIRQIRERTDLRKH